MRKLLFFLLVACHSALAQDAHDIVRRADERARGKSSEAVMNIDIVRPTWSRKMSMKAWSKGKDYAMILLTAPAKEKGTVFLKRSREVWNWIPSIERNIKLPPSMMGQSWMGTDFTNDDLVKHASLADDFTASIPGEDTLLGRACYRIRLVPRPEAAVVWGRIVLWIDKKDLMILKSEYYDEDDALVNTMVATEVKLFGGKLLPSRVEMVPAGKKGQKTVLSYDSLLFDMDFPDSFFSSQNMQRVK